MTNSSEDIRVGDDSETPEKTKKQELRKIRKSFYIYTCSVFVTFGSFVAMNSLQSSINIEDGLGNKTAMTTFGSGIICALFVTPALVRILGPKYALILSDICFLFYVAANAYPSLYTLIPGGVFAGIASATMWPCTSLLNVYFGMQHSEHGRKSDRFYVQLYTAYFFGVFQFNQVIGNMFTAITFQISENRGIEQDEGSGVTGGGGLSTQEPERDVSFCGANDCQDPEITSQNLDQYNPPSDKSLYILIGILSSLIVLSVIFKFIFVPKIPFTIKLPPASEMIDETTVERTSGDIMKVMSSGVNGKTSYSNSAFETEEVESRTTNTTEDAVDAPGSVDSDEESMSTFMLRTLKSTAIHVSSTQQLLVAGLTFYDGMVMSFAMSELTRAYASCVIGLPQVGLGMITYGLGDIIFSFLAGKTPTSGGVARNIPFLVAFAMDATNYAACLLWIPNENTSWVIYLFFFGFGCADGLWQTLLNCK